jgi:hypothetical protein
MQLHPDDSQNATRHTVEALGRGLIGLDFANDLGDMRRIDPAAVKATERDFLDFASAMNAGDQVLVIVHNRPFALATVTSDYGYTTSPREFLGVWFRHYRRVDLPTIRYYFDKVVAVKEWEVITMTDAFAPLNEPGSRSYQLIEDWRR